MKFKEFPYKKYQSTEAWNVVDDAIEQLVKNNDLVETTARRYIVGFVSKQLDKNKLVKTTKAKQQPIA